MRSNLCLSLPISWDLGITNYMLPVSSTRPSYILESIYKYSSPANVQVDESTVAACSMLSSGFQVH